MTRVAVIAVLACLIATPALAGSGPLHSGQQQQVALSFQTSHNARTLRSARLVPASVIRGTALQAGATFNGHQAQACWADTVQQFECAWRGVIVTVQLHKHVAPMVVRVASTRHDSVKVRISITW